MTSQDEPFEGRTAGRSSWSKWQQAAARVRRAAPPAPASAPSDAADAPDDLDAATDDFGLNLGWPARSANEAPADVEVADDAGDDSEYRDYGEFQDDADDDRASRPGTGLAVPLLPAIAGRLEAVQVGMSTLAMRLDALIAAENSYRSATSSDLEELRRATERIERLAEALQQAAGTAGRGGAAPAASAVRAPSSGPAPATTADVRRLENLVAAVVDALPGSTEGSAAPLEAMLGEVQTMRADLTTLARRLPVRPRGGRAAELDVDVVTDELAAKVGERLAESFDAELLDRLADRVVERLTRSFDVVQDEPEDQAKRRRRR